MKRNQKFINGGSLIFPARPTPRYLAVILIAAGWFLTLVSGGAGDAAKTQRCVAVLRSEAGPFEKARACQQLGELGTEDAVPALASLLYDEQLSAYARSGLEGIGGPKAAEALRAAAEHLQGDLLVGVVNSLGVLRDEQSVILLKRFAGEPGTAAAGPALRGLGRIATEPATTCLSTVLKEGPDHLRETAAEGCLLAAERRLTEGQSARAGDLYAVVLSANLVPAFRAAATRGAILARASDQVAFLVEQLRSSDAVRRNAALLTIRDLHSDALAAALNRELQRAKPDQQRQLLAALADCYDRESYEVIEQLTNSDDPDVRETALRVLGRIGRVAEVEFLLKKVQSARSPEEVSLALSGVERIEGTEVDSLILRELADATNADARVSLIRLIGNRGTGNANLALLKQAQDSKPKVKAAALEVLKSRGTMNELPELIKLTRDCPDGDTRRAAEGAVFGACSRSGEPGASLVLAALNQESKAEDRNSWVRVLTSLGYAPALPQLKGLVNDVSGSVALNATEQLGLWPDPTPIDLLFVTAETGSNPNLCRAALASAIQLARVAAEEHQRADEILLAWFERANKDSTTLADKRLIISGIGRVSHPDSLLFLMPYLEKPELKQEAGVAILQLVPLLSRLGTDAPIKEALEKLATNANDPQVTDQANKLVRELPVRKKWRLFDGGSLDGWEGDTNVWRLREGVIVGGSMAGNPRNEFLATTRTFTNFVLRLEYKLIGTEGFVNSGVQFHSVRVAQPPNEMSGYQADIGAGYSGCLYDESRRNKFLAQPEKDQVTRLERSGEWNHYEVRCESAHIEILLNGERTVDYTESEAGLPHFGRLALQIHGGSKAEVLFRNITLVE